MNILLHQLYFEFKTNKENRYKLKLKKALHYVALMAHKHGWCQSNTLNITGMDPYTKECIPLQHSRDLLSLKIKLKRETCIESSDSIYQSMVRLILCGFPAFGIDLELISNPSQYYNCNKIILASSFECWSLLEIMLYDGIEISDNTIALIENISNDQIPSRYLLVIKLFFDLINILYGNVTDFYTSLRCKLSIGALMIFGEKWIANYLQNVSEYQLYKILAKLENLNYITVTTIKTWNNNVRNVGKEFVYKAFNDYWSVDPNQKENPYPVNMFYFMAKVSEKIGNYKDAKLFYIVSICEGSTFYVRTLALRYLSNICCLYFEEFGIALKTLNGAFRICCMDEHMCITPTFVKQIYIKQKKK
eukprot:29649_1